MSELAQQSAYPYTKGKVLYEVAQKPGADALQLHGPKQTREVHVENGALASLATHRDGNMTSELRLLVSVPGDEHLYGVVGVTQDGQEDRPFYGLSALPVAEGGIARWQGNITRGIARIQPPMPEARTSRELPWSVSVLAGPAGSLAVSNSGAEFVDVIGVPQVAGQSELTIPPELWCPPADELVELVKPTA